MSQCYDCPKQRQPSASSAVPRPVCCLEDPRAKAVIGVIMSAAAALSEMALHGPGGAHAASATIAAAMRAAVPLDTRRLSESVIVRTKDDEPPELLGGNRHERRAQSRRYRRDRR